MAQDYYQTLGVSKNASADDIKKAFRKAAVQHHPDKAKGEADKKTAEAKFKELNQAYDVLKDPQKKAAYDQYGHAAFQAGAGQAGGNPFGGSAQGNPFGGFGGFSSGGFNSAEFNTEDLFDMFFGGNRTSRGSQPTGHDLHYSITVPFDQAVHGGEATVQMSHQATCTTCSGSGAAKGSQPVTCDQCHGSGQVTQASRSIFGQINTAVICPKCQGVGKIIKDPCPTCHGQGRTQQTEDMVIHIPAGTDNGTELRFAGRGDAGANGSSSGDLYIEFKVQTHKFFKRRGNDIYVEVPVTLAQAALGDTIEVPTIDGITKVKIPAGVGNGTEVKLTDKGVPNLTGKGRGNQYLITRLDVPKKLSAEQKKLLEQLHKIEPKPKMPWG